MILAVHPMLCLNILQGKATVVLRNAMPKTAPPFTCYVLCTWDGDALCYPHLNDPNFNIHRVFNGTPNGRLMTAKERRNGDYLYANGSVVAEFVCDAVERLDMDSVGLIIDRTKEYTEWNPCMSRGEIIRRSKGLKPYGLHISELRVYDKPRSLRSVFAETSS